MAYLDHMPIMKTQTSSCSLAGEIPAQPLLAQSASAYELDVAQDWSGRFLFFLHDALPWMCGDHAYFRIFCSPAPELTEKEVCTLLSEKLMRYTESPFLERLAMIHAKRIYRYGQVNETMGLFCDRVDLQFDDNGVLVSAVPPLLPAQ